VIDAFTSPVVPKRTPLLRITWIALILFFWLLPFHSLIIAMLFGYFRVSAETARLIAAWKEAVVALLIAWVILRAMFKRSSGPGLALPDLAVTTLLCAAVLFKIAENPIFRAGIPVGAEFYGIRDSVFFMLLYYVGRSEPHMGDSETVLKHAFFIALVVSIVGILERLFVSPDMLVVLGVAAYVNDFLGMSAYTVGNAWNLPQNYWSILAGIEVRRSGSVFLHSQGFALPFLFLMPAASAWALGGRTRNKNLMRLGYALIWMGLLLTLTRMTILVCLVQLTLFFLMVRKPEWAVGSLLATGVPIAILVAIVPGLLNFVWQTITWQSLSSTSHLKDWTAGLVAFAEQPWGHGLGTTDAVAVRFGLPSLSQDNLYFSYAVQYGLIGITGLVAFLGSLLVSTWRASWTAIAEPRRRFAIVVALTTIGIMINGITSVIFSSTLLAYVFFWQAGAAVTMCQQLESPRGVGLAS
jgi:hypothetical protein